MRIPPGPIRPLSVRVLAGVLLLVGLWNGVRSLTIWRQLTWLASLEVDSAAQIRIGLSLLWAVLFVVAAVALWRGVPFARRGTPALFLLYAVSELAFPLLSGAGEPAPMRILSYAALIGISWWLLNRPPAKLYFDSHIARRQRSDASHEPQN